MGRCGFGGLVPSGAGCVGAGSAAGAGQWAKYTTGGGECQAGTFGIPFGIIWDIGGVGWAAGEACAEAGQNLARTWTTPAQGSQMRAGAPPGLAR